MEKITVQRQPTGYLFTQDGHEYYLMRPEPIAKDSWQLDNQQRWSVIRRKAITKYDEKADEYSVEYFPVGDTITIVTSNPTIEFCIVPVLDIEIEIDVNEIVDQEELLINKELSKYDFNEEERQQLRFDLDAVAPI